MSRAALAKEHHPYYPESWLCVAQAQALLQNAQLPTHITMTNLRKMSVEVSSTGHIRKESLDLYVQRVVLREDYA